MPVIHIQVASIQMHISMKQHHSQDRKTLLCQLLWSADIKKKNQTQTMLLLWSCPLYSSPYASALWDKSFSYQSRGSFMSGKTQGHSIHPHPAHCICWTCSAFPKRAHGTDCFAVSMHGVICGPGKEKTQMDYLWYRISLGHRQKSNYITWVYCSRSMAASAYFLWSTSFPTRKGRVQIFRSSWIFVLLNNKSRGKPHSLKHFLLDRFSKCVGR